MRRVAIVGLGVKAPGGTTAAELWRSAESATPQARVADDIATARPDSASAPVLCRIDDDDSDHERYFRKSELRRVDPNTRFGVAAAHDAVAGPEDGSNPGLALDAVPEDRRGCVVGTGVGGLWTYERQTEILREQGFGRLSPFTVPMMMPNSLAGRLAISHGLGGVTNTVTLACASGTAAIGEAMLAIRHDRADLMIAGGTESLAFDPVFSSFSRMEALARADAHPPAEASRPFAPDRTGFVLGEGAAMLVLLADSVAEAAGVPVLGWVDGYGASSDAHHMVAPLEDGAGAARAMALALADAAMGPDDIGHINAHGTSTPRNDLAEAVAIGTVFGTESPPVTATKGVTGHLLGASGAVEALVGLVAAILGRVPPIANTVRADPEIELDLVLGRSRPVAPGPVLSNSFAFGGHNATLVISPGPDAAALAPWGIA